MLMSRLLRSRLIFPVVVLGLTSGFSSPQSDVNQPVASQAPAAEKSSDPPQTSAPETTAQPSEVRATVLAEAPAAPDPLGDANALYRKGDYDGALRGYQQLLRERPSSPDAQAGIARVYLKQEKIGEAFQTIAQAIAHLDSPHLRVVLGEILFRQGKITEAEKEWVDVVNGGRPDARAYLGLARVREAIAMYKTAKKMIDKAHQLDPEDPEIQRFWIGTLARTERIQYYERYLAGPNNSDTDERGDLESYLTYLKERAKQQDHPCRLVSKVTSTETPLVRLLLDPTHLRGYGLPVVLNGTKARVMLDTGASGIVVNRRLAERAGITRLTETKIWGVGDKGRKDAYIGTANSIRIGELEFQNCPVEVIESRSVAEEEGLIGADVFEDFLVEIDFPDERLKLTELPKRPGESDQQLSLKNQEDDSGDQDAESKPDASDEPDAKKKAAAPSASGPQDRYIAPEMQSFTRVFRFGHDLLVPTKIGDAPYKLFLLDTGALNNAISPQAAREVTKVHGDSDTIVKGISGSVKNVYSANKAVLQFGRLRQENQDMLSFDTSLISQSNGTEVSGFLGFVMLRFLDIKIDYRDALVDFSYDPKRLNHF
jgi:thioredoxin-like negative regulator of GroEL